MLLDRAVRAVNDGDLATAHDLAGQVLQKEAGNAEAADLLATDTPPAGELRRLTILSCDLVGSTELSERLDPEPYHGLVRAYRARAREIIEGRYDGHITSVTGDGIFALFGYPTAHEEDAVRAVKAALDICRVVEELSAASDVDRGRVARRPRRRCTAGMVLIDEAEADVYGLAANVTARVQGLGEPGRVADLGAGARRGGRSVRHRARRAPDGARCGHAAAHLHGRQRAAGVGRDTAPVRPLWVALPSSTCSARDVGRGLRAARRRDAW